MKKKKKSKLFIFLIICFVLMPFLFTKGCNYMESLNQAESSVNEPISSVSEQIQHSASAHSHIHKRAHNAQVHSIRKANWIGTAVPNSGYVENIYFNTNLSVEEVKSLLNDIEFQSNNETLFYGIISNDLVNPAIAINKMNNEYLIALATGAGGTMIFSSSDTFGFIGWSSDFSNPININVNAVSNAEGLSIGGQNEKLSSLVSVTPFEQSSSNELSIGNLFAQLANAILLFGVAVVELFLALEPIFWNNGPTLIFILLIAGVAFALASWGLELLISLIGVFKTKRKKKK